MSVEALIVFALIAVAIVLFSWERVSFDVTALIILSTLLLTGILTPKEGLAGFSNPATITIGAMFVLSEGLRRTGALERVGDLFAALGQRSYWQAVGAMMLVIGVVSAFINNTAAVAIFIPVVIGVAGSLGESPSKLLIPLSFASMFGGVCTLIGTSTNILVSSIAVERGMEPFGMFEFTPLGIILLVVGFLYIFTVGIRLVPARREGEELTTSYEMKAFLTDVVLDGESEHIGHTIRKSALTKDLDLDVLQVFRSADEPVQRNEEAPLEPGNVLRIRGGAAEIAKLLDREDIRLLPAHRWYDVDFEEGPDQLVEAVAAPDSALASKRIEDINFPERFGAVPLAIRQRGELTQERMNDVRLAGGDAVLLNIKRERAADLKHDPSFVLATEVDVPEYRRGHVPLAVSILAGVVLSAAFNLVPIVVSAVAGCVLLVLTGCLTTDEAYQAINWKVIVLLAGVIPLGTAMQETGAADTLSNSVIAMLGDIGPTAVLSGFFFLSMMLTNVISNQATAALLAPIAIDAAATLDISARPLLMAVTFAASLSFMTPVGYQTNTMIYGPGQYKFTDFIKVGTPLNLILWVLATFLIPWIWPF